MRMELQLGINYVDSLVIMISRAPPGMCFFLFGPRKTAKTCEQRNAGELRGFLRDTQLGKPGPNPRYGENIIKLPAHSGNMMCLGVFSTPQKNMMCILGVET